MTPINRTDTEERLARIDQMIEEYRSAKQRRLVRQAIRLWRRTQARQNLAELEAQPEWVQ